MTYTSRAVSEAASAAGEGRTLKERLDSLALALKEGYGLKLYICELFGRRWSSIGGLAEMVIPEERIELGDNHGMIIENCCLAPEELDELKELILNIIEG